MAQQVEAAEVVGLAERILAGGLLGHGEELGGDNLAAVLEVVSVGAGRGRGCGEGATRKPRAVRARRQETGGVHGR